LVGLPLFAGGVLLVVWASERFLEGLVGVGALVGVSTFAISAVLSGLEAENVAVGVASGAEGLESLALGTVFGGAVFLVCVALGLAAVVFPLRVRIPRQLLIIFAATPVLAGVGILTPTLQRPVGVVLLIASVAAMAGLLYFGRNQVRFESEALEEVEESPPSAIRAIIATLLGLVALTIGGELVAKGAEGILESFPAAVH